MKYRIIIAAAAVLLLASCKKQQKERFSHAQQNYEAGEYAAALPTLDSVLQLSYWDSLMIKPFGVDFVASYYVEALNLRGLCYYGLDRQPEAEADFTNVARLRPDDPVIAHNMGLAFEAKGHHDDALELFDKAIKIDPKEAVFYFSRGKLYKTLEEDSLAIADFSVCLSLDSNYHNALLQRALVKVHKGEPKGALADIGLAKKYDPQDLEVRYWESKILLLLERYRKAEVMLRDLLDSDYPKSVIYNDLGFVNYKRDKIPKAKQYFILAIKADSLMAAAYNGLGLIYSDAEQYDSALVQLNKGIALDSTAAGIYFNRGNLFETMGKKEMACADFMESFNLGRKESVESIKRVCRSKDEKQPEKVKAETPKPVKKKAGKKKKRKRRKK